MKSIVTVALPVFNSKNIAWVCMEGLCRQKTAYEWELIICEEQDANACGQNFFSEYAARLHKAGCVSISYIAIYEREPLSMKWKRIADAADERSDIFILQAADCFSHPLRIASTKHNMDKSNLDWYQELTGHFFDVKNKIMIRYNHELLNANVCQTALNMATRTKYVKAIPAAAVWRGVDGWMYKGVVDQVEKIKVGNSSIEGFGVDTHGLNNISKNRQVYFTETTPPFEVTKMTIKQLVPADIAERLCAL